MTALEVMKVINNRIHFYERYFDSIEDSEQRREWQIRCTELYELKEAIRGIAAAAWREENDKKT